MSGVLEQTDHVGYTVPISTAPSSSGRTCCGASRRPVRRGMCRTWGESRVTTGLKVEAAFFDLPGGLTLELIRYHNPPHETVDMETYNVGNAHLSFVTDDLHRDLRATARPCRAAQRPTPC